MAMMMEAQRLEWDYKIVMASYWLDDELPISGLIQVNFVLILNPRNNLILWEREHIFHFEEE